MSEILDLALQYLEEYNFSIFPVNPAIKKEDRAKAPLIKEVIPYRTKKATREEVIEWWTKWPDAMIAMPTGTFTNLMVLDADEQDAVDKMNELLPESFHCPTVKTPGNDVSKHYYFKYRPGLSNDSRSIIHVRTEGAYIVLPGSVRADGKSYLLQNGCSLMETPDLPDNIYNYLLSFSLYTRGINNDKSQEVSQVSSSLNFWEEGRRDESLFHTANCLIKGNCEPDFAESILNILVNSWGENDTKWVHDKVKSAVTRSARRGRNIAEEVREWVNESQGGLFKVSDWYRESHIVSKEDKHAVICALKRLCDDGIVERIGKRTGEYRIIERDFTVQQWWEDQGKPIPLKFPLGVETLAKIYPGNIVLLEGQKSQGKSAFALEFCRLNRGLYKAKTRYQNVEMSDSELLERFRNYPNELITQDEWKESVDFVKRTSDWWDLIEPDAINVVDYLVEYEKAYLIAQFVFNIHQKLKNGIALIVVQRDPFKPYPSGGRAVRDIPRLVLSLVHHKLKLEDVKSFYTFDGKNPTGLVRPYKQVGWWDFRPQEDWQEADDEKYSPFMGKSK